jgi:pimeloyl-ACP methyl ester carboxylesterase
LVGLLRADVYPDVDLGLVAAENGKARKTNSVIPHQLTMHKMKLKILSTIVLALQVHVAFSEDISNRTTVTVRGQGPDVVLIPGLACSTAVWDATVKKFEGRHRLHLVQVAGFAGAPARGNASGAIIQPTVDAIDHYIKTNHLKTPKVIGHSMGGLMGMMLAIQHPEDVSKLMVVDALPFFSVLGGAKDADAAAPQAAMFRDLVLSQSPEAFAEGEKQFLPTMVKSPEGLKLAIQWGVASDKSVVARAMYEVMTTDIRHDLHKIKAPVTMLYPWDSQMGVPRESTVTLYRDNFAALPGVKMVCIDGSLHFIMFDQPEKFAAAVDGFLKN